MASKHGIEPRSLRSERNVLPLNYLELVLPLGFEPSIPGLKGRSIPRQLEQHIGTTRLERATSRSQSERSSKLSYVPKVGADGRNRTDFRDATRVAARHGHTGKLSRRHDSNVRPLLPESSALPS